MKLIPVGGRYHIKDKDKIILSFRKLGNLVSDMQLGVGVDIKDCQEEVINILKSLKTYLSPEVETLLNLVRVDTGINEQCLDILRYYFKAELVEFRYYWYLNKIHPLKKITKDLPYSENLLEIIILHYPTQIDTIEILIAKSEGQVDMRKVLIWAVMSEDVELINFLLKTYEFKEGHLAGGLLYSISEDQEKIFNLLLTNCPRRLTELFFSTLYRKASDKYISLIKLKEGYSEVYDDTIVNNRAI